MNYYKKTSAIFLIVGLILLSACSGSLSEDQQVIADACLLEGKGDKKTCRCMAKNLAKKMNEADFQQLVELNRNTLEAQYADAAELGFNALGNAFGAIDLIARNQSVMTQVALDCKK